MLFICLEIGASKAWENTKNWERNWFSQKDLSRVTGKLKSRETLSEIASLLIAYSNEISSVSYMNNDWVLLFKNGEELYWAHGRLLPKVMRKDYKKYRQYISYHYPDKLEDPASFTPQKIEEIKKENTSKKRSTMPPYEGTFYELLYGSYDRASLEKELVRITFLGRRISVHNKVKRPMQEINRKIQLLARRNSTVAHFVNSIRSIHSYAWRKIRGSTSMSFHSLAVAVDILPKNRQKILYWGWEAARNPNWPIVSLKQRWIPPKEIIKIFEDYGFIWGGRWVLYDNMHFEYRPELLVLSRLEK